MLDKGREHACPGQNGAGRREISPCYSEWCALWTYALFTSEIFHLLFPDHGWPRVIETTGRETAGKGARCIYSSVFSGCAGGAGAAEAARGLVWSQADVACSWLLLFNVFPTLPIPHLTAKCGSQWAVNMAKRLKALGLEKEWIKILALLFSVIWLAQSLDFSKLRLPHL